MQSYKSIELVLKRGLFANSSGQIGELFDEHGEFICHILEDPSREIKIYGETAIPPSTYQIEANHAQGRAAKHGNRWLWHAREIWHLRNVRNFTYIQVHPGNRPADTLGCLLPGEWNGTSIFVGKSVTTYKKLYMRYADQARAGVVSIRIEDVI